MPIAPEDRKFTAFEANCELFEFRRFPFGLTNAVPAFQRAMNEMVKEENLKDTYPYMHDVTVAEETKAEHDRNVRAFETVCIKRHITINEKKTICRVTQSDILDYRAGKGKMGPDPERLRPLQEMEPPSTLKE